MLNKFLGVNVAISPFSLQNLEDFPYEEWENLQKKCDEQERWLSGEALEDQPPSATGRKADLYPMRINPIFATVMKHAYALFGEVEEDGAPLITTRFVLPPKIQEPQKEKPVSKPLSSSEDSDEESEPAEEIEEEPEDPERIKLKNEYALAEEALKRVWWENNGRSLMIENGIISNTYGGCIFKATYTPWDTTREYKIRIERVNPRHFIGYPDANDMYRLSEVWIARPIDSREAKKWGYEVAYDNEELWYTEHWLNDTIEYRINDKLARRKTASGWIELGGNNPFGFIPVVYIPHLRATDFQGINTFDHLKGYVKELNLRMGDFGDAINDDSHPVIAGSDLGMIQNRRITDWLEIIDIGATSGITGNEKPPALWEVRTPRASIAMQHMLSEIWKQYCRDSFTPPVSYGEDEGSQRSGTTLLMRFWPLGSHVATERYYWTTGMDIFQSFLLRMLKAKVPIAKISANVLKARMKQSWSPLLPRDREVNVQEWATRATNYIASIEHLIELAGDVEDVPEEKKRILRDIEDVERAKLKAAHEFEMELQEETAKQQKELAETQGEFGIQNTMIQGENQAKMFGQQQKAAPKQAATKKPAGGQK